MDDQEFQTLVKHCYFIKKSVEEAKSWLDKCYGEKAPCKSTIYKWYGDFELAAEQSRSVVCPIMGQDRSVDVMSYITE